VGSVPGCPDGKFPHRGTTELGWCSVFCVTERAFLAKRRNR